MYNSYQNYLKEEIDDGKLRRDILQDELAKEEELAKKKKALFDEFLKKCDELAKEENKAPFDEFLKKCKELGLG